MRVQRTSTKGMTAGLAALALMAALTGPAAAYQRPGRTERVSVATDGTESNVDAGAPAISADGRYVAFRTLGALSPDDTNKQEDIYLRDRALAVTEWVTAGADKDSHTPEITPDGRYIVFMSIATNLVPGDTNGFHDIFVHDRSTGATERVSVAADGTQGDGHSYVPSITPEGRYVAFVSYATKLVQGDTNNTSDVFVVDRSTGIVERVSVTAGGAQANGRSYDASISHDGRYVAFMSSATNLVPGDTNEFRDIFVRDRVAGTTERVSVARDGAQGDADSDSPRIGADGRYVVFMSGATNLVPGDTNGFRDMFLRDRASGRTERVSVGSDGAQGNGHSGIYPSITPDGRFVVFMSGASNLVPGDTNEWTDVFVRDRVAASTDRASVATDGTQGTQESVVHAAISPDGRYVVWVSSAGNLVPDDTNDRRDVFVRERGRTVSVVGPPKVGPLGGDLDISGTATFSGAVVASATDPDDDGVAAARSLGAELEGASLVYRAEEEDVLIRLPVASLPPLVAGLPAVVYGLEFQAAGSRFEVRALRAAATGIPPPSVPHAALYRCSPVCIEDVRLNAAFGTTGDEVFVSLPLAVLGTGEEVVLSGLRAFTAAGEAAALAPLPLDEVQLANAEISVPRVEFGIAPAGTPEAEVAFDTPATLANGSFSGTLPTPPPGGYDVWAEACLGAACGSASTRITIP